MKLFKKILVPICLTAVLSGCKKEDFKTIGPFPVEQSVGYTTYDIEGLIDTRRIAVNSKFIFLVGERADTLFQQYSLPDVRFVKGFGQRGRGPGEYQEPPKVYMSPYSERFYILDMHSLQSYDIEDNGDLIPDQQFDIKKGDGLYNSMHVISDSLLVYWKIMDPSIEKINLLTNDITGTIDLTTNAVTDGTFHPNEGSMAANSEHIVYVYDWRDQIDIYNLNDMSLKVRLRGKDYKYNSAPHLDSKLFYTNVYATEKYFYAFHVEGKYGERTNNYSFDVFDWDGNPVKKINLPRSGMKVVTPDDTAIYSYYMMPDGEEKILKFNIR